MQSRNKSLRPTFAPGVVAGLHLLPIYPSSGDGGFAPLTYKVPPRPSHNLRLPFTAELSPCLQAAPNRSFTASMHIVFQWAKRHMIANLPLMAACAGGAP